MRDRLPPGRKRNGAGPRLARRVDETRLLASRTSAASPGKPRTESAHKRAPHAPQVCAQAWNCRRRLLELERRRVLLLLFDMGQNRELDWPEPGGLAERLSRVSRR